MTQSPSGHLPVYIGTYTQPHGQANGIYLCSLSEAGLLRPPDSVPAGPYAAIDNPSYLLLDPHAPYLFAVNETQQFEGQPGGGVAAFAVDPAGGALSFVNRRPVHGSEPCHLCLDPSGRWLLAANYASGSVTVLPVAADGSLGAASDLVQHAPGPGPVQPHAHSSIFAPSGAYVVVADLGLDSLLLYRFDPAHGRLAPFAVPVVQLPAGAGPRHLAFSADGRRLYCLGEFSSAVTVFACDAGAAPQPIQSISALPAGFAETSYGAHVALAASGRYLYASNRGHDSLAVFAVDPASGLLSLQAHVSVHGEYPRHFAIDPGGRFLLVANQRTDCVAVFRIDPSTGIPVFAGSASIPTPVCVQFGRLAD